MSGRSVVGLRGTGAARKFPERSYSWPWIPGLERKSFKDLKVSEHSTLQFRVEAFNIWNHTNFQSIATKLGAGGFGQIASDRDPRQMQLEAKYSF